METKTYWVGDRPGGAWIFNVLDQRTGQPYNLAGFPSVRVLMVGSDNEQIVIADENAAITDPANGVVTFLWPTESVFTRPGRYALQLELYGPSVTRKTTVQDILVRELGGITR